MGPGDRWGGSPTDHAVETRRPPFHHVHVLQLAGEEGLHGGLHRQPGAAGQLICKERGRGEPRAARLCAGQGAACDPPAAAPAARMAVAEPYLVPNGG